MLLASRLPDDVPLLDGRRSARPVLPRSVALALPCLGHLAAVLWLFRDALLGRGVFYFRDVTAYYFPEYTFVARALAEGVWPLWNHAADAGGPYLMGYPVNLLLVALAGPERTLALAPPLHVLLAACGATVLGLRLGFGSWGAWVAGAVYAFSGWFLSQSFFPNFYAAAWAPWIFAVLSMRERWPGRRWVAALALLAALEISTFGGEVVLQTALLAAFLTPRALAGRALARVAAACGLAVLIAAPVLLGTWAIVEGTQRGRGFEHAVAFGYSATPLVLVEAVLPRFFGDVHTFSDVGFWGQPFFRAGYPYIPSLYIGPVALLLAALAGRSRLWLVALLGVLMSLGDHGPLEGALVPLLTLFRAPVKFFFLTSAALALLAGRGMGRVTHGEARVTPWVLLPGLALAAAGLALAVRGDASARLLAELLPALADARAQLVVRTLWPWEFLRTGLLCAAAGIALVAGRRFAPLAGVLAACDLLAVNATLNPTAAPAFYALQAPVKDLVERASAQGTYRWFSYGVLSSPDLQWDPAVALRNSDVALYSATRQSLVPITHELDGLEGAFDLDHMGWAPPGSTLSVEERTPARYRDVHRRLRLANVRWVISFHDLPHDLVIPRGEAQFSEIRQPQRLYELRDALPRAFWVGEAEVVADPDARRRRLEDPSFDPRRTVLLEVPPAPVTPAGTATGAEPPASVRYERLDPHAVRIHASTPPGFLVVLDGHHRDWRAQSSRGAVPLWRANGRYWALHTPGGSQVITVRYEPSWRRPAVATAMVAMLVTLAVGLVPPARCRRRRGAHG